MTGSTASLGFVGVGKHSRRLRDAFLACGARVEAYDRKDAPNLNVEPAWGERVPWAEMVVSPDIDAIVCCAPPEVTVEVAALCARSGKRLVATKPLLVDWDTSQPLAAAEDRSIYVDLWRLYSPAWLALKAELRGKAIRSVHVDFYGDGPVRSAHSGLLDYGPHALAFVLDLGLLPALTWREGLPGCWGAYDLKLGGVVATGNGYGERKMSVEVYTGKETLIWEEVDGWESFLVNEQIALECSRDLSLSAFCRAFLAHEPSDTLRISCEAMRLLRQAEPW